MRIKEVVLEGFKSYATRTVISGFDIHFNAITGLNGSGKSNILDAICFVLGISTLSLVRVTNMQELIYKNGQAGVTKANVTILFDNTDKAKSHEAYKKHDLISVRREISVGGGSKYTINGTKVTGDKVKNLFVFAGLNVNNANFLIMQGRITQVINMKPREIMSLVEETAGINVYEAHKKKAIQHMTKKQNKLDEINRILEQELIPKLEQLRQEKENYLIWKSQCEELTTLENKLITFKYIENLKLVTSSRQVIENYELQVKELILKIENYQQEHAKYLRELEELKRQDMSEEVQQEQNALETFKINLDSKRLELERVDGERQERISKIQNLEISLTQKLRTFNILNEKFSFSNSEREKWHERCKEKEEELERISTTIEAMKKGINVSEEDSSQLISAKQSALSRLNIDIKSKENELEISRQDLANTQKKFENSLNSHDSSKSELVQLAAEIAEIERQVQGLRIDEMENNINAMHQQRLQLEESIMNAERELGRMGANRFGLNYSDPEPGFDRSKVKGRVIRLITMKNPKYARALEAGSGGSLFSVVVENDAIASILLKRKSLGNVKILPNNRMKPRVIPDRILERVQNKYGNKAIPAISLIDYDRSIENSIKYVFGGYFVCESSEIAKGVAYDNSIGVMAVTLEGDSYDPTGSISGGASLNNDSPLQALQSIQDKENNLKNFKNHLTQINRNIEAKSAELNNCIQLKNTLEYKRKELHSKERLFHESSHNKLEERIKLLEAKIERLQKAYDELNENRVYLENEIQELDHNRRRSGADKVGFYIEKQKKLQKEMKSSTEKFKEHQDEANRQEEEMNSLNKEQDTIKQQLTQEQVQLISDENHIKMLRDGIASLKDQYDLLREAYETKRAKKEKNKGAISDAEAKIAGLEKHLTHSRTEQVTIENKLKQIERDSDKAHGYTEMIEKKHPWVTEQDLTILDFSHFNFDQEERNYQQIKEDVERQGKKINKKVISTLEDQEVRYSELSDKKRIVTEDKARLEELISELDDKKTKCINETWVKVDQNLSEIFSTLLLGASASLSEAEGGLELKVGFNGVWKKNLSELSGGQRSLLALSFILALLKYNPAPIYILDEIDAALDLSHTQNIGTMVRRHFSQSQFIVVSLKEGMFTNANVLFRTQFVEGRSMVERHALRSNSADDEKSRKSVVYK